MVDLKERIIRSKLTKKESAIAEYVLYNISKACFMSASDLAKELNTSNTSVNRMAKALGYKGFNELQKDIQEYIASQADSHDKFRLPPNQRIVKVDDREFSEENLVTKYFELTTSNIMSVLSKNSLDRIERIADILASSNHKYISGYRGTADLANKLGFLLNLITENVILATSEDFDNIEKVMNIREDDCIVIISFNRYKKNALDIINISKERLAKLILITDRATAPFAQYADELLIVDVASMSFFNSNVAPMFLLELICTILALKLDERAKKRLNMLEPYMNRTQIF